MSLNFPPASNIGVNSTTPPSGQGWQDFYHQTYASPSGSFVDDVAQVNFPELFGFDLGASVQQIVYNLAGQAASSGKTIFQLDVWRNPPSSPLSFLGTGIDSYWIRLRHSP